MDGLEKILDKLGVFNILAVFVPRLIIGTDAYLFLLLFFKDVEINTCPNLGLVYVIASFILGMIFYEIGYSSFAFTRIQDRILFNVISRKDKLQRSPHLKLCDYEYQKVKEYINNNTKQSTRNEKCDIDKYSDVNWEGYRVYNYCKFRVKEHQSNNSIVAMSRTLCAYFFVITLMSIAFGIWFCKSSCCPCLIWLFVGTHAFFAFIFLIRTIRNYELMYATVIKEFYQSII